MFRERLLTSLKVFIILTILPLFSCHDLLTSDESIKYENPYDVDGDTYNPGVLTASFTPTKVEEDVYPDTNIIITFNHPIRITGWSVNISPAAEYTSSFNETNTQLTIHPSSYLEAGTTYRINLDGFISDDIHQLKLDESCCLFIFTIADKPVISFNPQEGSYSNDINVEISCSTDDADIYYTTDETYPLTSPTSQLYTPTPGGIPIEGHGTTVTINAVAVKGSLISDITTASFEINWLRVSTPSFIPLGGAINNDTFIEISCLTDGTDIYYTTDESDPSTSSTSQIYPPTPSGIPVEGLGETVIINAIAVKSEMLDSTMATATYTIDSTTPQVESVTPGETTGIAVSTLISITFDEPMDVTSITCNTTGTAPSGTIQLSDDNFVTCIRMSDDPVTSNGNKTFQITPASNLEYETTYKIKITTDAQDAVGNNLEDEYLSSTGFTTGAEPVYVTNLYISAPSQTCEENSPAFTATATADLSDGTTGQVVLPTWSENSSYASVDNSGNVTTYSVSSDQSFVLTATYSYGGETVSESQSVAIINKYASSLRIDGDSEIDEGDSEDYDAYVTYGPSSCDCGEVEVTPTWSENSSYATVNSSGTVTVGAVSSDTTFTLTASYSYGSATVSDTQSITINDYDISFSLACSRDAYIDYYDQYNSFGSSTSLVIAATSSESKEALLYFDILAEIPVGSSIKSATLQLYPYATNEFESAWIFRVINNWSESVTWATAPGGNNPSVIRELSGTGQYSYLDVQDIVQVWVNDDYDNNGFLIVSDGGWACFYSSEASSHQPRLSVTYSLEP